jgi:transcription elongation factor Elf1
MPKNVVVEIPCPGCGHKNPLATQGSETATFLVCSNCNEVQSIEPDELLARSDHSGMTTGHSESRDCGVKTTT